jgi:hypothetical protein
MLEWQTLVVPVATSVRLGLDTVVSPGAKALNVGLREQVDKARAPVPVVQPERGLF